MEQERRKTKRTDLESRLVIKRLDGNSGKEIIKEKLKEGSKQREVKREKPDLDAVFLLCVCRLICKAGKKRWFFSRGLFGKFFHNRCNKPP